MIKPMNRIEDDFAINLYAGYFFYYRKVYVLQTDNKPEPNQNIFFCKNNSSVLELYLYIHFWSLTPKEVRSSPSKRGKKLAIMVPIRNYL